MHNWHQMDLDAALQNLETNPEAGLSQAEAERRLQQYGPNELVDRGSKSPWKILLEQLTGVMTIILIISAVISIFLRDVEDAVAILAIVILNTILGFSQEYRAERAMLALKKMSEPHVRVRRDGKVQDISSHLLVPGDIVLLEAGNVIPADGRLIQHSNLRVQEAVLTGESEPVEKLTAPLAQESLPLGDQRNRLFMGTVVTYGRGLAAVTETGMSTELGRIADMIQGVGQEATPLQRKLEQLGKGLAAGALVIVAVVFLLGLLRGEDLRLMFLTAISLAVAAVPEGLPTVVTIGLALGAQRMLGRRALIRKLPAVETLGSVTVICSDKTGTLTENRMTVTFLDVANRKVDLKERTQGWSPTITAGEDSPDLGEDASIGLLLAGGALCNDATLEQDQEEPQRLVSIGDPTEGALVIAAARAGLWKSKLDVVLPRVGEIPFDSERKRMTTIHSVDLSKAKDNGLPESLLDRIVQMARSLAGPGESTNGLAAFTKGAVDGLLQISSHVLNEGRIEPLDERWRSRIESANNRLAQNGMRVLGLAFRSLESLPENPSPEDVETGLVFIGLAGMIDPARPEVFQAVKTARTAGVRPIMITGDHPLTALYIATELGITRNTRVLTGVDLEKMGPADLAGAVKEVSVFARVSPEHKLKIVQALQSNGEVVAMTGDGVNDAPALKKAEIGVAMGITGTDVSKESADMVLLDDNFATIVAAVEEGRRIYDNILKFIRYALGSNIGEILVMLVAPFLGMPLPLLPLQILWINLVTDGLPGLALTLEPAESDTMKRPPHPPQENVFSRGLGAYILWLGVLLAAITLGVGYWGFSQDLHTWQTMAFTTLTLAQMGHVLAIRSNHDSIFSIGLFSNRAMVGAVLSTVLLQLAVIYVPFLQGVFETVALPLDQLILCLVASLSIFLAVEIYKWVLRRGEAGRMQRSQAEAIRADR